MKATTFLVGGALLALALPASAGRLAPQDTALVRTQLAHAPTEDPAWLGVFLDEGSGGVIVDGLVEDGPGQAAGLREGDRLTAVAGADVSTFADVVDALARHAPGDEVTVGVLRGDEEHQIGVTLGRRPGSGSDAPDGVVTDLTSAAAPAEDVWLGVTVVEVDGGVEVERVVEDGPASAGGVRAGDVIYRVGPREVASIDDLADYLAGKQPGRTITVRVRRGDAEERLRVKLGSRPAPSGIGAGESAPEIAEMVEIIDALAPADDEVVERLSALGYIGTDVPAVTDGAWLGVFLEDADGGAGVADLIGDGPAKAAGLQAGDVINRIGGKRVENADDLIEALGAHEPGDEVRVRVVRGEETVRLDVVLGARPAEFAEHEEPLEEPGIAPAPAVRGIHVLPATPSIPAAPSIPAMPVIPNRPYLGVYLGSSEEGVSISGLVDGGPSEGAGVREGDQLLSLGDRKIEVEEDVHDFLAARKPGDVVKVVVLREGGKQTLKLELGSRPGAMAAPVPALPPAAPDSPSPRVPATPTTTPATPLVFGGVAPGAIAVLSGGGYMGVQLGDDEEGVYLEGVIEGTPAAQAGLQTGDRILKLFGEEVASSDEVIEHVRAHSPGDEVAVVIRRDGKKQKLSFELGARGGQELLFGGPQGFEIEAPQGGMLFATPQVGEFGLLEVPDMAAAGGAWLGVQLETEGESVFVTDVVDGSPAAEAGVRAGDRILSIGKAGIASYEALVDYLAKAKPGKRVPLVVARGDRKVTLKVTLGEREQGEPGHVEDETFGWFQDLEFESDPHGDFRVELLPEGVHVFELEGEHDLTLPRERVRSAPAGIDLERVLERIERMEQRIGRRLDRIEERLDQLQARGPAAPRARGQLLLEPDLETLHEHLRILRDDPGSRAGGRRAAPMLRHLLEDDDAWDDDAWDDDADPHQSWLDFRDAHSGGPHAQGQARVRVITVGPDGEQHDEAFDVPLSGGVRLIRPDRSAGELPYEIHVEAEAGGDAPHEIRHVRVHRLDDGGRVVEEEIELHLEHDALDLSELLDELPDIPGHSKSVGIRVGAGDRSAPVHPEAAPRREAALLRARIEELEAAIRALRAELGALRTGRDDPR